jgi:hypothetical protein
MTNRAGRTGQEFDYLRKLKEATDPCNNLIYPLSFSWFSARPHLKTGRQRIKTGQSEGGKISLFL